MSLEQLVDAIVQKEIRSIARLISQLEAGEAQAIEAVQRLHQHGKGSPVIGITGAPGAGKSTLTDALLAQIRKKGNTVAVLAIDPSSPFSGGAILGDRVRMARHNTDRGVFIRSMAARGRLGAIAAATADAVTVLDAAGFDYILIETVGVGQNELDVMQLAQTVIILLTPAAGDSIQADKAGLLEIGSIFVVNKADMSGADRLASTLRETVEFNTARPGTGWCPPVIKAQANRDIGAEEIYNAVCQHATFLNEHPTELRRLRFQQMEARIIDLIDEKLRFRYQRDSTQRGLWKTYVDSAIDRHCDPHTAAEKLLKAL